jgi:hypothetical protein
MSEFFAERVARTGGKRHKGVSLRQDVPTPAISLKFSEGAPVESTSPQAITPRVQRYKFSPDRGPAPGDQKRLSRANADGKARDNDVTLAGRHRGMLEEISIVKPYLKI